MKSVLQWRLSLLLAFALCAGLQLRADRLFVDDDNFGKAGLTGETEALAFGTLQDAVKAAQDGDEILVLPGTYDQGYGTWNDYKCRLCVTGNKSLTIRSTGGKAVTTIKGAFDSADTVSSGSGIGPDAVRAVCVAQYASSSTVVLEGFTITDSTCYSTAAGDNGYGGAVYASEDGALFVVDCEIRECTGSRGITYKATLVRCYVHDNVCVNGKGTVNYRGKVFNSVAVRNSGDPAFCASLVFNTTLGGHTGKAVTESTTAVNCLMTGYTSYFGDQDATSTISNCVVGSVYWSSNRPTTISPASANNVTNAVITQCAAPFEGDFRLVGGSDAIGAADAGLLADFAARMPAGIDLYVDYLGNAIPKAGPINAGAVQTTVTPQGGAVLFKSAIGFFGDTTVQPVNYYRHAVDSYPQQWHVTPALGDGQYVIRYQLSGLAVERRCPLPDDSLWLMPPPFGTVCTGTVDKTSTAFWVDPETGSDEPVAGETRGTQGAPFKTLQKAADVCMTPGKELSAVVFAAEGIYAEGGAKAYGSGNRLYCSRPVRFIGRGIGKSIIKGELDLSSDDHGPDGRGVNAKRCVALAGAFVQGFTLTDGRCAWLQGATGKVNDTCGGCAFLTSNASINDCLVTNCIAERGSAAYGEKCFRTRIVDCPGGIYSGGCYACLVIQNPDDTDTGTGNASPAYFSTGLGTSNAAAFGSGSGILARYCIADGGKTLGGDAKDGWRYNALWNYVQRNTTEGYVLGDPCFVDKANGDYRVKTASSAFVCGTVDDDTWKFYTCDIEGRPLVLTAAGTFLAGAFQNPVQSVTVAAATKAGVTVTPAAGTYVIEPGASLTVTAADGSRHFSGYRVNGEFAEGATCVCTAPAAGTYPTRDFVVEPIVSTDWYVNPEGDDDKDGFTPDTAMKTFEMVMVKVEEGDTVHAAHGIYNEGFSTPPETATGAANRARVYVEHDGVTLVADEGRDVTFIEGEDAPSGANANGQGVGAMRCVYVVKGAKNVRIKGFTFRKGRTAAIANDPGGAVWCDNGKVAASARTVCEDCCFTNNIAYFGGATCGGVCMNCTFIDNKCSKNRAVSSGTDMYGCYFDRNVGTTDQGVVYSASAVVNCTFGPDNKTSAGAPIGAIGSPNAGSEVRNCVILCANFARLNASGVGTTIYNCALKNQLTESDVNVSVGTEPLIVTDDCLDAEGRPVKDSALVDAGDNVVLENSADYIGAKTLDGGQRVYNGTIDIGAFEYDWRADYAAAIGGGVTVTDATPGVELAGGKVRLADGAAIAGVWPEGDEARNSQYTVTEKASNGTLTGAFVSGDDVVSARSVTDRSTSETFKAKVASLDWSYAFAATGDDGYAEVGPFAYTPPSGLMLIVR